MSPRFLLLWFAITLAAALFSRAQLHASLAQHCSIDGISIEGARRVDLFEDERLSASFCSVECALAWPRATGGKSRFVVHEELHGQALDPMAAYFVRSGGTPLASRKLLRAFQDPLAAAEHARAFGGIQVPNPFSRDQR